jgi:uncharacterized protein involved in cysteine biosynthesis
LGPSSLAFSSSLNGCISFGSMLMLRKKLALLLLHVQLGLIFILVVQIIIVFICSSYLVSFDYMEFAPFHSIHYQQL